MSLNTLVTGASGFLGRSLVQHLLSHTDDYVVTTSRQQESFPNHIKCDLSNIPQDLTKGIDTVIHLAARAHITREYESNPRACFFKENVDNTLQLAENAIQNNVKRFIFISTIGVYGYETEPGKPFTEISPFNPHSYYAESKLEAESKLKVLCEQNGLSLVILRLPLVYHISAPANFGALVSAVKNRRMLPFARINNKRSLLSRANFNNCILSILASENEVQGAFLLSDPRSISTTEILKGIATSLNEKPRLFYVPKPIMKVSLTLLGKQKMYSQLWNNLEIDATRMQQVFNWCPEQNFIHNLTS